MLRLAFIHHLMNFMRSRGHLFEGSQTLNGPFSVVIDSMVVVVRPNESSEMKVSAVSAPIAAINYSLENTQLLFFSSYFARTVSRGTPRKDQGCLAEEETTKNVLRLFSSVILYKPRA
jgi:hypothetical protein